MLEVRHVAMPSRQLNRSVLGRADRWADRWVATAHCMVAAMHAPCETRHAREKRVLPLPVGELPWPERDASGHVHWGDALGQIVWRCVRVKAIMGCIRYPYQ